MQNFVFQNRTRIVFGRDEEQNAGREAAMIGSRFFVHYGSDRVKKTGLFQAVADSMKAAGLEFVELGGVEPNPRLDLVREGIELCRNEKLDAIICIGGGSVIDSAKAIAMGVPYDGDVWDFYTSRAEPSGAMPIGVVLTIPAAGSESSGGTVVTNLEEKQKFYCVSEHLRPHFAILNPELTCTLPKEQTAAGAADIMAHIMERYFTREPNVDFTDRLCEATLRTIIDNVPKAIAEPENYDARAEVMWAGTIAHNDLLGTGRIGDWASHDIEHELSAQYDVTHGFGLAVVFPAWMKHVYKEDPARFVQFAVRVWDVEDTGNQEEVILEGISRMEQFFSSIGLPVTLKELGVTDDRYEQMAAQAMRHGSLGNFKALTQDDVVEIYRLAEGARG